MAHAVRVGDDRLALGGQLINERAHAPLVVRIGPLEVGDLGMHHQFEFASARKGAFHAIAHGGDFAADGLGEDHHLVGAEAAGIGEANGDFAHGARGVAHFLEALGQGGHDEEESHWTKGPEGEHGHLNLAQAGAPGAQGINAGHGQPASRNHCGDDIAGALRAILEGLQDLADGAAVVIGGLAGGADGCGLGLAPAPDRLVRIQSPRKVLRVVDLGHARGLDLAGLRREVERLLDGGERCVRGVRVHIGAHHGIDPRTQCADAILDRSGRGAIRGFRLYRHIKPPHMKRRIRRRFWRPQRGIGVAVR